MAVKKVEEYINSHPQWREKLIQLRELMQRTDMKETIKWGVPVYTVNDKNVVGIAAFKNHLALWFYNGALLTQNTALLQNAQEGKTKGLRQIRFYETDYIDPEVLELYLAEAIQNQKEGREIKPEVDRKLVIPEFLQEKLDNDEEFQKAYAQLTKGKQREYADYISEAKREATKQKRLEKIIPIIKEGKGLHDKYKNC